jgi:N-formylglutamate amidohydrolase
MARRRRVTSQSIVSDLMLAPMVAAMRMPMFAAETQRLYPWRSESHRAVTEKLAATSEGIAAAQLSYLRSVTSFWPEIFSGRTPSLLTGVAAERSVNAALKPASRRVKANFKRLSAKS